MIISILFSWSFRVIKTIGRSSALAFIVAHRRIRRKQFRSKISSKNDASEGPDGLSRIRKDPNLLGGSHLFGSSQSVTRSLSLSLSPHTQTYIHTIAFSIYTPETHCNFKRLALRAFDSFLSFRGLPEAAPFFLLLI